MAGNFAGNFRGQTFNALMQPRAVYDRPLTFRGAIAPLGTYQNPDGTEDVGFAWPGMITEPLNALQRLHENSYTEDGRLGIPNPQYQGNKDDALTALLSIYAGNALNPATRLPENALGMFAGRNAKTANLKALSRAEDMAGKGASREDIWNDTGWFQGADDKWRFEIDDSEAAMKWRKQGLLSKVLKHDDLYAAYPSIGDIKTRRESGLAGLSGAGGYKPQGEGWFSRFFSPASIHYSAYADRPRKTLLHEAQHALQQKEGFARGARSDEYSYIADKRDADIHKPDSEFAHAKKAVSAYADEMMKRDGLSTVRPDWKAASEEDFLRVMDDGFAWDSQRQAYEDRAYADLNRLAYDRSAGEVEARNVQVRADMTPEQRRATPPWLTQDVPFEKQFVQQYGQRSPLPPQPQAPPQGGIRAAWMEPVYPEILPPAPVASTAEDALRWMRESGPIIDGELLSDTGRPSIAGSAIAAENANAVKAWHSTPAKFDTFDNAYTDEVGFHFGSKNQAHNRAYVESGGNPWTYFTKWRDIPVEMDVKNPANISRDVGQFNGENVARQLVKDSIAPIDLLANVMNQPEAARNAAVRNWLVENGYDAVKYPNRFEGVGDPSYMMLNTGNVRHARTGDTLYSDTGRPSIAGATAASADQDEISLDEFLRRYGVTY